MSESDLLEEILLIIEKNGRATQKYLFDVFVNCQKKYKNISKYQIKKAVKILKARRKIRKALLGESVLYYLR
jgi:hypothetical protein